jgi:pimeloyl-ACP methyl ester carboxylesterase
LALFFLVDSITSPLDSNQDGLIKFVSKVLERPTNLCYSFILEEYMALQLLATKTEMPPPRPHLVTRHRLLERLDNGLAAGSALVFVSAPAGYGKTTVLSDWVLHLECLSRPVGVSELRPVWLTLDDGDNDPTRFLSYLAAGLRKVDSALGQRLLDAVLLSSLPAWNDVLATTINELVALRTQACELFEQGRMDEVLHANVALAFHPDNAADEAQVEGYLALVRRAGAAQLVRQNRAVMARPDLRPLLPRITCPTLVMVGEADQLTTPEHADEIAAAIAGAQRMTIAGAGHMLTLERPDGVAQALLQWLHRLP